MIIKKLSINIKPLDIFALVNIGLFFFMCYFTYFHRFVKYRGYKYRWEFFVYAIIILLIILFAWKAVRHFYVPGWMLIMVQLGICMHFAGGLACLGNKRLYDTIIMKIRYDKYVHLFNAAVAGLFVQRLPLKRALKSEWLQYLVVVLIVMGTGAFVEIIEYMVMLTIKVNGVGLYDNNMQDLIANFIGVTLCLIFVKIFKKIKSAIIFKIYQMQNQHS